jgi:hypothetical protein
MSEFYRTTAGRKFYETDMPKLIAALEKIAIKMDESNKLEEKKFKLEEKLMKRQIKELNEMNGVSVDKSSANKKIIIRDTAFRKGSNLNSNSNK